MRVYQLANQLNITSKRVLEVAEILGINVKAHQSSLSEEDVSKIIKYLKKNRRIGIVFNKTILTLIDGIKKAFKKRTFATGLLFGLTAFTIFGFSVSNANDSVSEAEIIDTVDQVNVPTTTPVELIDQEMSSSPLFTDSDDSTTTTVPVTTTTTVPVTCDDESFQPYTLYTISGKANTVMSCRNEQDALESGYVLTVNPVPPPSTTTTTTTIPVSTSYIFVNSWYPNAPYTAAAIDIDSNKNVYVTGAYRGTNQTIGSQQLPNYGSGDVFVYKLNDLGDLDWVKTYGNSSDMSVYDIAVDQNGNSIITGYFIGAIDFGTGTQTSTGGGSTFVLKLDTNGETEWVLTSTSGLRFDYGYGVDTDSNGNIYVSGIMNTRTTNTVTSITFGSFTISSNNLPILFYLKINSSGVVQWVKTLDWGYQAASVFVDSQDNKYLSGRCLGTGGGPNPYVDGDRGTATFSNVDGDDIATLSCTTAVNFGEAFVIKLDSSDNYVWHWNDWSIYSGNTAVISNSNGDVFVSYWINYQQPDICGSSISGTTQTYYVLVKLDSTGTCQWFYKSENSVYQISHIMRLGVDSSNNIYMYSPTENGLATHFFTVFNNEGVQQNSLNTWAHDFVFDTDDNVYLLKNAQVRKSALADIE